MIWPVLQNLIELIIPNGKDASKILCIGGINVDRMTRRNMPLPDVVARRLFEIPLTFPRTEIIGDACVVGLPGRLGLIHSPAADGIDRNFRRIVRMIF